MSILINKSIASKNSPIPLAQWISYSDQKKKELIRSEILNSKLLEEFEIISTDKSTVWHHLMQHKTLENGDPLVIVKGKGLRVEDANGREYLDATSGGVWCVNVGYGRERIANAIRDQLVEMCYFANSGGNVPGAIYAEKLLEKMPGMGRVYYSNSGSEANEKAYKIGKTAVSH